MEFFMLMIAPYLVVGTSLLFLFFWINRGDDSSLE